MSPPSSSQRVSRWEWTQTALLAANLTWTTLCLGGYRPETMMVTAALTSTLFAVHLLARAFESAPESASERTLGAIPPMFVLRTLAAETRNFRAGARSAHLAGWLLVPFLGYAAINAAWLTPVPWLGSRDWLWWANAIAVFWVVLNEIRSAAPRRTLFLVLVALAAVASGLAAYQHFVKPTWLMLGRMQSQYFLTRVSGSFGIPNSLAALLVLLIPPVGALAWRAGASLGARLTWGAVCIGLTYTLVLTISRGAWLGLAVALSLWPLLSARWGLGRRVGVMLAVVCALFAVGAGLFFVSPAVRERLALLKRDTGELSRPILWRAAGTLWREHPAVGSGAGSFNVLFEKYRPVGFLPIPQWAHNDYLNTLSDYGAIGFALFFGAGGVIAWVCLRRKRARHAAIDAETEPSADLESKVDADRRADADRAADWLETPAVIGALAVGLLAFALQLLVDFHFKIPALAMTFATIAALVVQRAWPRPVARASGAFSPTSTVNPIPTPAARALAVIGALGVLAFAATFAVPHFRAEALRSRARETIQQLADVSIDAAVYRATLPAARADLARAVAIDPANAQAWADVSYADSLWVHAEPAQAAALGASAEAAANRALALSAAPGEFWIRRGAARDLQGRWPEAGEDFSHALERMPNTAFAWYYFAYHLSLKPSQRDFAWGAVEFCLHLDPSQAAAISLRHRLAIKPQAP